MKNPPTLKSTILTRQPSMELWALTPMKTKEPTCLNSMYIEILFLKHRRINVFLQGSAEMSLWFQQSLILWTPSGRRSFITYHRLTKSAGKICRSIQDDL